MPVHNYTPHEITIYTLSDGPLVLPSIGVARCSTVSEHAGTFEGIALASTVYGPVEGLPEPDPGVVLVVSGLVLDHPSTAGRRDLAAPGELVRHPATGQPTGCRGLRVRAR